MSIFNEDDLLWRQFNEEMKKQGLTKVKNGDFIKWIKTNDELISKVDFDTWQQIRNMYDYEQAIKKENFISYMQLIENLKHEKDDFEILQDKYLGKFYFHFYDELLKLNIDKQYMTRFIYLCTFLDYDNKIHWGKSNNGLATEKDLKEILNLSKRETINTKNIFKEHKLIFINEDKTITINNKYCKKGNANRNLRGGIRMFEYGIKELYENSKSIEHKRLGMLMQILPTVNYEYNVLCANPEEKNKSKIIPLNMKDICKIVGYEEKNSKRLQKELIKIRVDNKAVVMVHTTSGMNTKETEAISINPQIYYKGHNQHALEYLLMLFDILDK